MLEVLNTPEALIDACDRGRSRGQRIGVVPTMGNLHDGHLSLVTEARRHAETVVLTLFVNPLQFGPNEDFSRYPRTLEADLERCRAAQVNFVFAPALEAMFPPDFQTHVEVGPIAEPLEGRVRPGHFRGVATVVTKLLQLVGPCDAIFGQKDYQQFLVLRQLVRDLNLRVRMHSAPIVREADGLAMSSRNQYLSPAHRQRATAIFRGLEAARIAFGRGERDAQALRAITVDPIARSVDAVDYVEVAHPDTLAPLSSRIAGDAVILVAARIGGTRLIDNARVTAS